MNLELKYCNKCNNLPECQIHGISYIIICEPCNIKTKTAVMYFPDKINDIYQEWNDIN